MNLEQRITAIEARNHKVAQDKAWEVSATRRLAILIITYLLASVLFTFIEAPRPFVAATVPTLGYGLSTLSLPLLKHLWQKYRRT